MIWKARLILNQCSYSETLWIHPCVLTLPPHLLTSPYPRPRLFSHVDDPFLDDPLPREYVLYLRPSGPLLHQLSTFWQQSRVTCGKNKAHNIFPHITLCQFFMVSPGGNDMPHVIHQHMDASPFEFSSPWCIVIILLKTYGKKDAEGVLWLSQ